MTKTPLIGIVTQNDMQIVLIQLLSAPILSSGSVLFQSKIWKARCKRTPKPIVSIMRIKRSTVQRVLLVKEDRATTSNRLYYHLTELAV